MSVPSLSISLLLCVSLFSQLNMITDQMKVEQKTSQSRKQGIVLPRWKKTANTCLLTPNSGSFQAVSKRSHWPHHAGKNAAVLCR